LKFSSSASRLCLFPFSSSLFSCSVCRRMLQLSGHDDEGFLIMQTLCRQLFHFQLVLSTIICRETMELLDRWRWWSTRKHVRRAVRIVCIQIYRAFTFLAIYRFALLLHHHATPFCASILKPNLREKREETKKNMKEMH
jgi:hypothetical protein